MPPIPSIWCDASPRVPPPPEAAKRTLILVLVGRRDGGSQIWRQVAAPYREAGIPLSVEYVAGLGHTWLLGKDQTQRLMAWLDDVAAGKLPATTVGKPDAETGPMLGVVLDGMKVAQIAPGSPAEKAGIEAGDLIESVDGKAVASRGVGRGDCREETGRFGEGPHQPRRRTPRCRGEFPPRRLAQRTEQEIISAF